MRKLSIDDDFAPYDLEKNVVVLLFLFLGLAVGVVTQQLLSRYKIFSSIPYTVVIFFLGMAFAGYSKQHDNNVISSSINDWARIDADLLLFVFLPPLIFGEASRLNFFHVRQAFAQSVLLAGPGVLLGAGLMTLFCKLLLPYNWSWTVCVLFSAILSATDTVAVLSVLLSAGASPKLTMLVVGESLGNDGTSMVLFFLCFNILKGETYDASQIFLYLVQTVLGSCALGIGCGIFTVRWLRTANRPLKEIDTTSQIAITMISAYLVFFVAQFVLEISGALAVCSAALMLAWQAPPIILNRETMLNVWEYVEWIGNTLIFLISGLIIGNRVLSSVNRIDWLYVVILYLLINVSRAIVIGVCFPFLSKLGPSYTRNEAIFISWAGLRGALGMALALIVVTELNEDVISSVESSRIFFYVGGIASLTLMINAAFSRKMIDALDLINNDSVERFFVMEQIRKRLTKKMERFVKQLESDLQMTPDDVMDLQMSCSLLRGSELDWAQVFAAGENIASTSTTNLRKNPLTQNLLPPTQQHATTTTTPSAMEASSSSNSSSLRAGAGAIASSSSTFSSMRKNDVKVNDEEDDEEEGGVHVSRRGSRHVSSSGSSSGRLQRILRNSTASRHYSNSSANERASVNYRRLSESRQVRLASLTNMMSVTKRGPNSNIVPALLAYVRTVFLEMVRVKYWHIIEAGKVPRASRSAQFLLYSVDVGLDGVNDDAASPSSRLGHGFADWIALDSEVRNYYSRYNACLLWMEAALPESCGGNLATYLLARLASKREKRSVYLLSAFIEAHEHAQKKIHAFVWPEGEGEGGEAGGEDEASHTIPEEARVKADSVAVVEKATALLACISQENVAEIRARQAAFVVLNKQAALVKGMVTEGLLNIKQAEEFLEEITEDQTNIEEGNTEHYERRAAIEKKLRAEKERERPRGNSHQSDLNSSRSGPLDVSSSSILRDTNSRERLLP